MTQRYYIITGLALGLYGLGCGAETPASVNSPAITSAPVTSAPLTPPPSAAAGHAAAAPATPTTPPPAAAASTAQTLPPPMAAASAPPAAAPENHESHAAAAGAAAPAQPPPAAAGVPGFPGAGGGATADAFCAKYEMYCHYGQPMRHADKTACVADYNGTPAQQGCKNMHLDTAIAGTAAACNGMPSDFCFSIHCLHAAGLPDPTGTTYCK